MKYTPTIPQTALGMLGASLAAVSGALIVGLAVLAIAGYVGSPYIGIFAFLVLPAVFVLGLLLVPVGSFLARRRERLAAERGGTVPPLPVVDLNDRGTRARVIAFAVLTGFNILILALAGYKGLQVMDSPAFCGACHKVMDPEFAAYQRSPHARVACVECHIGEGASWFVKSKLSGAWQLVSVSFNLYQRPIPTPIHNLRPARETCEECHWPYKFSGDRLHVTTSYAEDDKNTPKKTVVLLHVGGGETAAGPVRGIHAHVAPGVVVRYLSDPNRTTVSTVEATFPNGRKELFRTKDSPQSLPPPEAWRRMDCIDCHNRPTHLFRRPDREVDQEILSGHIDASLPFVKREGLKAIQVAYPSHDAARAGIEAQLVAFYRKLDPAAYPGIEAKVKAAADALGNVYCWNVWPQMKITWGTYPTFLGHDQAPGCFRCHDGDHKNAQGKEISQDCALCHSLLAVDEENPKILAELQP
ncbi:MAG TPA: NapC/NirT family cytochrome c [Anaeromyxobacteraceae bacterium]|nr:NapC/NirT family cytochrome c [Anaeromyxobacteraceae bacterium]